MDTQANQTSLSDNTFALELGDIMKRNPTLTIDGFEDDTTVPGFDKRREILAESVEAYTQSVHWVGNHRNRQSINKKAGNTYVLKHRVEEWYREHEKKHLYVPEGALIAAAIYWERKMKRAGNGQSVFINIT
jgi:hypothetical protein